MDLFLGIDVGSVSTNLVVIDPEGEMYLSPLYLRTQGQPIKRYSRDYLCSMSV